MAPPGKHVISCFVQYALYHLNGGWTDEKREAFGDAVVDTLAQYIPNLKQIILHRQVLTPVDIERITGISQGNIFHGELSLSQLFFLRPVGPSAAHPSKGISNAGREPIPAAASPARPATTPPAKRSKRSRVAIRKLEISAVSNPQSPVSPSLIPNLPAAPIFDRFL